ncbi:Serine/threonine protein kinase [Micromonospora purpureochromogenes]|uniref:non-specific serine/threonine protein kinase n=1 Tax=Micromonospora purpureochromogenes TaxID=47872 RepID=A0A1C4Z7D1_9ACTN|nr:BREX system serine/threonine kinase PglW [Micromonospora purpureochromogenes]SCF28774.1 Serine/threonine protein kinase [Micromonospora purpureochromogenes]
MQEGRWTTVTPSQFEHEREALEHIRGLLPDSEPYRAWSNFTFTAETGHVHEVDLLVVAPGGIYLIEVKSLHGRLWNSGSTWMLNNQSVRTFDNPLHLADSKAKRLRSLLTAQVHRSGGKERIPFIQGAVFLSVPSLQVALDAHQLHWVFGPEQASAESAALPGVWSGLLGRTPRDEPQRQLTAAASRALGKLLDGVGVGRSRRYYQVGSWKLDGKPWDVGPTWQDHLARHTQFPKEQRRVRIYLVERNSAKTVRASIERAARREMLALHGISHPGIVQVDGMEPHEGGPALIFRHDHQAMRLDHFMAQYGEKLEIGTRLDMIRQLAEAMAYAHGRKLYHRALAARSVLVKPGRARTAGENPWADPQLQISDWQAAVRESESTSGGSGIAATATREGAHLERSAEAYLAPELNLAETDPIALDVFGLGTLSYLLLSGKAPATSRAELMTRLAKENGLRPSADADSVSEFMDELVQAATAPVPARRLATVAEVLDLLVCVEEELTAPAVEPVQAIDLLEARPGDVVSDWKIKQKLGTGSTSRAFLAENLQTGAEEVLKVALSDEKRTRLEHEARVLRGISQDSGVIRLAREEPIEIPPRTMIVLEHAGSVTVARKLREDGRLTVDELETYSDYLFHAVDHLQGEGVYHRDIKPDNIAIRVRKNRTRQLVLFDFSLSAAAVTEVEAGTPGYLDPFLGTPNRPVYDDHAEWYAVAVTLHEMASGELPMWGDGSTEVRFTEGPPTLAVEAFDSAIREGLVAFFSRALDRDAKRRFPTLREMRAEWQQVFRRSDRTAPVGSVHPEDEDTAQERDAAAGRATRVTVLEASGLTLRAVSAAHRLNAHTVGELLALGSKDLFTLPGLGAKTRGELQQRLKQWRTRLHEQELTPVPTVEAEPKPASGTNEPNRRELARIGLDGVVARLAPRARGRNHTEVEAVRLLLRLPDAAGVLPGLPSWPQQPAVAARLEVTPGRIAQILMDQRKRWRSDPLIRSVYDELVDLLAANGRVASVAELAAHLLARRGSSASDEGLRAAMSLAVVRAAIEIDPAEEPRFLTRRHGELLLVALEVGPDDPTDTPAAPALLDHADALGKVAQRLAGQEVLPSPATVLRELSAVGTKGTKVGINLGDRRTVHLAAAASGVAAASPRLEIYPRDLDPVRALRLSQAGVVPAQFGEGDDPGLTPLQIQERVRARFPELPPLPEHPALHHLLTAAGFDLTWRGSGYRRRKTEGSSVLATSVRRRSTATSASPWTVDEPTLAEAIRAEQRLGSAGQETGFRALTVRTDRVRPAVDALVGRFAAQHVSVTARFLVHLRRLVSARSKPTWRKVLSADAADPNSRDALKLAEFTQRAWQSLRPELLGAIERGRPLLLDDGATLARYRAMGLLEEIAQAARDGAGPVWVLCPAEDPSQLPRLDHTVVAVPPDEWITLTDEWADNKHRSRQAS